MPRRRRSRPRARRRCPDRPNRFNRLRRRRRLHARLSQDRPKSRRNGRRSYPESPSRCRGGPSSRVPRALRGFKSLGPKRQARVGRAQPTGDGCRRGQACGPIFSFRAAPSRDGRKRQPRFPAFRRRLPERRRDTDADRREASADRGRSSQAGRLPVPADRAVRGDPADPGAELPASVDRGLPSSAGATWRR